MGSVLVTTLDPSFGTSNLAGNGAPLDPLEENSAIDMMLSQISDHARNDADHGFKEAREIVQRVAYLPLAIQHCLGVINESGRTLAQFNKRYRSPSAVLQRASANKVNRYCAPYHQGLTEALLGRLNGLDEDSRALMDVLSLLHNVRIPESLFDLEAMPQDLEDIGFLRDFELRIVKVSKGLVQRAERAALVGHVVSDLSTFHMHSLL